MARPRLDPPAPTPVVPALLRYLRARGVETSGLAARFGLPEDVETRDDAALTPIALGELLEAAALLLGEPYLALELPAKLPFRRYGLAELTARASATLRDGLARLSRYAPLVHPQLELLLRERDGEATVRLRTPSQPRGVGRHLHEYGVASVLTHLRQESGRRLAPSRVWFVHARPPDLTPLERFFATRELSFGDDDNGFALPAGVLDGPAPGGDPRLLATLEELAEAALRARTPVDDLQAQVTATIRAQLPGDASMDAVAHALHLSPRTLQRRLEAADARFSELLDGVREELARTWLQDLTLPLAEVGYRLGFSDLATFSRAFKRWTGKPPGTFRHDGPRR